MSKYASFQLTTEPFYVAWWNSKETGCWHYRVRGFALTEDGKRIVPLVISQGDDDMGELVSAYEYAKNPMLSYEKGKCSEMYFECYDCSGESQPCFQCMTNRGK